MKILNAVEIKNYSSEYSFIASVIIQNLGCRLKTKLPELTNAVKDNNVLNIITGLKYAKNHHNKNIHKFRYTRNNQTTKHTNIWAKVIKLEIIRYEFKIVEQLANNNPNLQMLYTRLHNLNDLNALNRPSIFKSSQININPNSKYLTNKFSNEEQTNIEQYWKLKSYMKNISIPKFKGIATKGVSKDTNNLFKKTRLTTKKLNHKPLTRTIYENIKNS